MRLPLLIGPFRFRALEAVILNKAMSLIVVATALPFRAASALFASVASNWPIILNLLAGSPIGTWFGAGWATKLSSRNLYRVLAVLLVLIAEALVFRHGATGASAHLSGPLVSATFMAPSEDFSALDSVDPAAVIECRDGVERSEAARLFVGRHFWRRAAASFAANPIGSCLPNIGRRFIATGGDGP